MIPTTTRNLERPLPPKPPGNGGGNDAAEKEAE